MLTCNIGENTINTFEYDKQQIRKWSNKGILKCPLCNGKMIYKHGNYKIPHFSHEVGCENENDLVYNHPETKEHINGKRALYKWLKTQPVKNLKLEAWIPETKQRPDIYFEYNDSKYVIEYQCSPIATKYDERRELYKFAGINDIWILGVENYEILKNRENLYLSRKTKTIERDIIYKEEQPLIYLNKNMMCFASTQKRRKVSKVVKYVNPYKYFNLNKCDIKDLFDLNAYENKKYKRDENEIQIVIRKIVKDIKLVNSISNINIQDNKIYVMYGNIKKLIHVCWDESEIMHYYNEGDYVPIIVSSEFYDFKKRDPFNKFKEFKKCNYVTKDIFCSYDKDKDLIMYQFNLDDVYYVKSYDNRLFKSYKIRLFDGFYNKMPKSHNIGSYYKLKNISERNMSMIIKKDRINYLSVFKKLEDKNLRMNPSELKDVESKLRNMGYNNIEIYWG